MSGGSMEYLCYKVEEATFRLDTNERKAFAKHLKLVAKALHDIEWVDSGDDSPGSESAAIRACISSASILDAAVEHAILARSLLSQEIDRATKEMK